MTNPFMPRPIPVKYPKQYIGLEVALLKNNLATHDGYWYQVDSNMNLHPIHPKLNVVELDMALNETHDGLLGQYIESTKDSSQKFVKTKVYIPYLSVLIEHSIKSKGTNSHYNLLQRKTRYPNLPSDYFDDWAIVRIQEKPTIETFSHSLEAFGCYRRCSLHWIEAGKEKEFIAFATEAGVPVGWKGVACL